MTGRHALKIEKQEVSRMKIFGREPAVVLALVAAVVQLLSATVTHWSVDQQGCINAVAVALAGLITAWMVSEEGGLALLSGLVKAVIALALAFGLNLTPDVQSSIMVAVTAIVAFWVRGQVTAPEAA